MHKKIQLLFLVEWSIIGGASACLFLFALASLFYGEGEEIFSGLLGIVVASFFIITHFLLWKFPLETKNIGIFSTFSLIVLILNISFMLIMLTTRNPYASIYIIIGSAIVATVSLPFGATSLVQILKYRKELNIQSLDQTNETNKTN